MTDIRKHGFETDAQWREHLAEIEEFQAGSSGMVEAEHTAIRRQLADLRAELAALREQIKPRRRHRRSRILWAFGAGSLFLILMAAGR